MNFAGVYLRFTRCITLVMIVALTPISSYSATSATAQVAVPVKQNLAVVKSKIVEFLETQSIGYPGKVNVSAGAIDPNLRLTQCPDLQVFLPKGSRAWGKTSVGVRCDAPSAWVIYVQATVNVFAQYLVAAVPLSQGSVVTAQDILFERGDLAQLPAGVFTDASQAIGRTVNVSMVAGTVLRQEMLKVPLAVQRGQTVTIISKGQGFTVSAEGQAMANANEGQVVQVKVTSGQVITGVAKIGGQVEVGF
jgi:flagella basal body P-ring formation protein FlgA